MKGFGVRTLGLAAAFFAYSRAQELDTVLLRDKVVGGQTTILDQIDDPKERRAFLKLYEARDPEARRRLAKEFLAAYPQSWMLSQAYEIASKACIDLGAGEEAIQFGEQSLRILPENPLLLVPIASIQLEKGHLAGAQSNAHAALQYLNEFDRPASVTAVKWLEIRSELKATAHYILARIEITKALNAETPEKVGQLHAAEENLLEARALNRQSAEVTYLLALTELSLGKPEPAAYHFAILSRTPGPWQTKALDHLRRIYSADSRPNISFDAFLKASQQRSIDEFPTTASAEEKHTHAYAGSESCRPCHAGIFTSWRQTGMARMLRPYRPENVIGDFRVNNQFTEPDGTPAARMTVSRDKRYFTIRDSRGNWVTYPVDYTIGSKWQQAYATKLPNGDIHVFPVQYNLLTGKWINYWKMIDPPGSPRTGIAAFGNLSAATSYQTNCAPCHTSHLRLKSPGSVEAHDLEFAEGGVNCEMCHGPGEAHVRAMASGTAPVRAGETIVVFKTLSAGAFVAICAQCHAQSALRQPGPNGEMNYPAEGNSFPPVYLRRVYTEVSRRAFYKDGRFRETTFIVEAFRRSGCYARGQAHCGHCHQPHAPGAESNPTSLKYANDPDHMCLQCHSKFIPNPGAHTHHAASSEGSRCVACHMPRIMNSLLFQARTHQIDDIPNAGNTERFGRAESPNACLLCHAEKSTSWVRAQLQAW